MRSGLQAFGLSAGYGGRSVFREVNMEAVRGEILALVGPNGAGKTTLLRTMAGLLRPAAGRVLVDGVPLERLSGRARAQKVAYCPQQEAAPDWPLTVADVVALGRTPERGFVVPLTARDGEVVRNALVRASLTRLANRPISRLSGGEWQRVLIARALAQQASVLLLDEPVAHLDLRHQVEVLALLRGLASEGGLTVVASLHDLTLAAACADRLAVMAGGRLVRIGRPAAVLEADFLSDLYGVSVSVVAHPSLPLPLILPDRLVSLGIEADGAREAGD